MFFCYFLLIIMDTWGCFVQNGKWGREHSYIYILHLALSSLLGVLIKGGKLFKNIWALC